MFHLHFEEAGSNCLYRFSNAEYMVASGYLNSYGLDLNDFIFQFVFDIFIMLNFRVRTILYDWMWLASAQPNSYDSKTESRTMKQSQKVLLNQFYHLFPIICDLYSNKIIKYFWEHLKIKLIVLPTHLEPLVLNIRNTIV